MAKQKQKQSESSSKAGKNTRACWGLLQRRNLWVPTWRAWFLVLVIGGSLVTYAFRHLDEFLVGNGPVPGGVMVMEGWVPDYAQQYVLNEVRNDPAHKVYVTGGPVDLGDPLLNYKTLAELSSANLIKMGLRPDMVQAIPAPAVYKDRTYTSAMVLRKWFLQHGGIPPKINLFSMGPHGRRSCMLFQWAFGKDAQIGIVAIEDRSYDSKHWWRTSEGVRGVMSEFIAWCYARFLFSRSG